MSRRTDPLVRAYAACAALARSHYENFPVASRLLPAAMRPHVAAVYAFARIADDIADEGTAPSDERRRELDAWRRRLRDAVEAPGRAPAGESRDDLIIAALAHSIHSRDLPLSLFDDLVSAFGQDTTTTRYASWPDVDDYCRRSANPVGRLVLAIAGYRDERLNRSSDALCTALQLTNFWQDFGRDWRAGRLYVPKGGQEACGACEQDLTAGRMNEAWSAAIDACVRFTRARFEEGREVCRRIRGRLGLELRLTWQGGTRVLDRVAAGRSRLLHDRPTLLPSDVPRLLWQAAWWRR